MKMKLILVFGIFTFFAGAREGEERNFDVGTSPVLALTNISGDISVKVGDGNQVTVRYKKYSEKVSVDFSQNGDKISVKVVYQKTQNYKDRGDVDFDILFPASGRLDIQSISGSIDATAIHGDHHLKSVSGDVRISQLRGDLDLSTISGDVVLATIDNTAVKASSISGDVVYQGDRLEGGGYDFSTTSGNIEISHDDLASYRITGRTISGSVINHVGDEIKVEKNKYTKIQSISGKFGGGATLVSANTVSGKIVLTMKD